MKLRAMLLVLAATLVFATDKDAYSAQYRAGSLNNIAPAADVLMVRKDGAALARWQLGGKYHNLRADTVAQKPFWREAYRNRR